MLKLEFISTEISGLLLFASEILLFLSFSLSQRPSKLLKYLPYTRSPMKNTIVVDCSHPTCPQITHHLKGRNQEKLNFNQFRGDSTTDGVINCIKSDETLLRGFDYVTSNHFDIDSFLSLWCSINTELALKHEHVLRECAKIGDFRELSLDADWKHQSLRLACWLNSEEKRIFFRPFEGKGFRIQNMNSIASSSSQSEDLLNQSYLDKPADSNEEETDDLRDENNKITYFLPRFQYVLESFTSSEPDPIILKQSEWEYNLVCEQFSLLHNKNDKSETSSMFKSYPNIGLVVVSTPNPLHYYALFSVSHGLDIVVSMYSGNRYEVEIKYTSYVDINSRGCLPRVDLKFLAQYLNSLESKLWNAGNNSNKEEPNKWKADSITDSGPILRIQPVSFSLTKAERYGHPYERQLFSSFIPPSDFEKVVISFFTFAYDQAVIKKDWSWSEIHQFNSNLNARLLQGKEL
jgi:hypothetical protein